MKPKKPGRSLRVADQIARDLAVLIPKEVRDPRVGLRYGDGLRDYARLCACQGLLLR